MTNLAFHMKAVRKQFKHFSLDGVDLDLPRGAIMGFVGPNGAGKSTTMRILLGLMRPDSGTVELLGYPMPAQQVTAKQRVGFVSEDMRLYGGASIRWHMQFVQALVPQWDESYANELLTRFDLVARQKVKQLSHGQRVKAALLLALARRPDLLILDEPTTGLDPVVRQEVLSELLGALQVEERSVFFSSHNTQDVEQISDLVTFIHKGRILESDDKESFLERWRRISLELDPGGSLQLPAGCSWGTGEGRHRVLHTRDFSGALLAHLKTEGVSIQEVQRMTLEEIFMTRVALPVERKVA